VGPEAGLDTEATGKFPASAGDRTPIARTSIPVRHYTDRAHPMGTGGKARPGRDADHSHHLAPRSRMSKCYTSFPPWRLHGVAEQLYFLLRKPNVYYLFSKQTIIDP
jgi:hypothetical protein